MHSAQVKYMTRVRFWCTLRSLYFSAYRSARVFFSRLVMPLLQIVVSPASSIEQKAPLLYIKNKGHNTYSSATLATLSVSLHNRIHKFLSSTEQYSQRIGENVESRVSSRGGLFLAVINVTLGALGDEVGVVGGCRDRDGLGAARTRPAHMIRHELERVWVWVKKQATTWATYDEHEYSYYGL